MLQPTHSTAGWVVLTVWICKDLKKRSEDDESDLDFGLHQEVLLKGLMHFVQDLARVGKSVENIHPDEITLEAIDNAIERA